MPFYRADQLGDVAPALEILDTRIMRRDAASGVARTIVDTVSDNAAIAGIVLGSERHAPFAFDLRWVGAIVAKDDEVVASGLGVAVLDDPVMGIIWLAACMGHYGQAMQPGQVILSGAFIAPIECPSSTRIAADYGAFGRVEIGFGGLIFSECLSICP